MTSPFEVLAEVDMTERPTFLGGYDRWLICYLTLVCPLCSKQCHSRSGWTRHFNVKHR